MKEKSMKEMVNNAKRCIEFLMENSVVPITIQYKKDDKIVSSALDILKLVSKNKLLFFKKEEIDKFAKHMKTQFYNKTDWKLLQKDFVANLYGWFRRKMIEMSEINDNAFFGALLSNAEQDDPDNMKFFFQPITKQIYEEIKKEAIKMNDKILQNITNNIHRTQEQQKQFTPEILKEIIDELKKTYDIDDKTGTITKTVSD